VRFERVLHGLVFFLAKFTMHIMEQSPTKRERTEMKDMSPKTEKEQVIMAAAGWTFILATAVGFFCLGKRSGRKDSTN
jgi:hypothetical protein